MKRVSFLCALLVLLFMLAGCWDQRELGDRAYLSVLAFDLTDDGMIQLTAAAPSLQTGGGATSSGGGGSEGGGSKKFFFASGKGKSTYEALEDMQHTLPWEIFLGHSRVLLFSEKLAKKGLSLVYDPLGRSPRISRSVRLAVVEGNAKEFLSADVSPNTLRYQYLNRLLETAVRQGNIPNTTLGWFLTQISLTGNEPVLPLLTLEKEGRGYKLVGTAAFKEDKMVGRFDLPESQVITLLKEKPQRIFLTAKSPTDPSGRRRATFEGIRISKRVSILQSWEGHLVYQYRITIDGSVREDAGIQTIMEKEHIKTLENDLEKSITEGIQRVFAKEKQWNSDNIGMGELARQRIYGNWKHTHWDKIFPKTVLEPIIHVVIHTTSASA